VPVTAHAEQAALYSCTAQNRNMPHLQHHFSSKENIAALSSGGFPTPNVYSQPHYGPGNEENFAPHYTNNTMTVLSSAPNEQLSPQTMSPAPGYYV
jgi:hypothetical protein